MTSVQALTFDVFGTVVDWRRSIIREGEALGRAKGLTIDWARFADAWRGLYQPMLSRVRNGELPIRPECSSMRGSVPAATRGGKR